MLSLSKLTKDRRSIDPQSEIHIRKSMSFSLRTLLKIKGSFAHLPGDSPGGSRTRIARCGTKRRRQAHRRNARQTGSDICVEKLTQARSRMPNQHTAFPQEYDRRRTIPRAASGSMADGLAGTKGFNLAKGIKKCRSANLETATWKFRLSGSAAWA